MIREETKTADWVKHNGHPPAQRLLHVCWRAGARAKGSSTVINTRGRKAEVRRQTNVEGLHVSLTMVRQPYS